MLDDKIIDELYTTVRGVRVPTIQIKQIEDDFGAKLVSDDFPHILLALDYTLKQYMANHDGKTPDLVVLREYPEFYYKPMVLNIDFLGMQVPGSYLKPGWFYFKRNFNK